MLRLRCVRVCRLSWFHQWGTKKSVLGNCSSPGATATATGGEFVAGMGKLLFLGSSGWIFAAFGRKGNGFICCSWRVGLARFEFLSLSFFFWFLVLVSVSLDEAGFLVQTPGVYLSRLGFLGINMRVFAGFCNAEQLVFGRFKAEPPPFGFKLGFRCDSLGSSLFCCSGLPSDQSRQFFGYRRNAMVPGNLLRFLVDSFSCQPRD